MATFGDQVGGLGINNSFEFGFAQAVDNGTWTTVSSTKLTSDYALGGHNGTLELDGTDLVHNGDGTLGGTVTTFDVTYNGTHLYKLSGLDVAASVLGSYIDSHDSSGLFTLLYGGNDTFDMQHASASAAADTLDGGGGNDTFDFHGNFNPDDVVTGDAGNDKIVLNGAYSGTLELDGHNANVESFVLQGAHSYRLSHFAAYGQILTIDGSALGASNKLTVTSVGSEIYGNFKIFGGAGEDSLTGGVLNDTISGNAGDDTLYGARGTDTLNGGTGNDTLYTDQGHETGDDKLLGGNGNDQIYAFDGYYTDGAFEISGGSGNDVIHFNDDTIESYNAQIDGGAGKDTVIFTGSSSGGTFTAKSMVGVETITVSESQNFSIKTNNATVAKGATLTVDAAKMSHAFGFDGSAEKDGKFVVTGGSNNDTIVGGQGNDILRGAGGADHLKGGAGHDVYKYAKGAESTDSNFDTVTGFDAKADKFDMPKQVASIGKAITKGDFNDLSSIFNASHLGKYEAVEFTPNSGTYKGYHFLIVDMNGHAGYDSGKDIAILLDHATHLGSLSKADFI